MSSQPKVSATTYCARHSDIETKLGCSRCDTFVCPRCMIHSPVGVRCADCGTVERLPTFDVNMPSLARAIAVAIVVGAVGGTLFAVLGPAIFYQVPFLDTIGLIGLGYGVGEAVSLSANRKRGTTLRYIAIGGTVFAYLIVLALGLPYFHAFHLISGGFGIYSAASRF